MNLDTVAAKLKLMAVEIEADKGPLVLLGLFLRDESPGLWDLVIAAKWMGSGDKESLDYIAKHLRKSINEMELADLSHIVILEYGGVVLDSFLERFKDHTGLSNIHYVAEGGAIIRQAYIILAGMPPVNPRQEVAVPKSPPRVRKTLPKKGKSPPPEKEPA